MPSQIIVFLINKRSYVFLIIDKRSHTISIQPISGDQSLMLSVCSQPFRLQVVGLLHNTTALFLAQMKTLP